MELESAGCVLNARIASGVVGLRRGGPVGTAPPPRPAPPWSAHGRPCRPGPHPGRRAAAPTGAAAGTGVAVGVSASALPARGWYMSVSID